MNSRTLGSSRLLRLCHAEDTGIRCAATARLYARFVWVSTLWRSSSNRKRDWSAKASFRTWTASTSWGARS
jgi:hypothetical protein